MYRIWPSRSYIVVDWDIASLSRSLTSGSPIDRIAIATLMVIIPSPVSASSVMPHQVRIFFQSFFPPFLKFGRFLNSFFFPLF